MRRTERVSLQDGGQELTIECTQMGAYALEMWTIKLFKLLVGTGMAKSFDIDSISNSAAVLNEMAKVILSDGLTSLANFDDDKFKKLHDQLLETCSIIKDGGVKLKLTPITIDGNIEDFKTIFKILKIAFETNLNFSLSGQALTSGLNQAQSKQLKPKISVHS